MKIIRYLLDENVDSLFRRELLRHEPEMIIWRIGSAGAPPIETPDAEILAWCEEHEFMLITNNRKSMPKHLSDHLAAGRHVPAIIELNRSMNVGATVEELLLIYWASDETNYQDRIVYLPIV